MAGLATGYSNYLREIFDLKEEGGRAVGRWRRASFLGYYYLKTKVVNSNKRILMEHCRYIGEVYTLYLSLQLKTKMCWLPNKN